MPEPRELPQIEPTAALVRGAWSALFLFVPAAILNQLASGGEAGTPGVVAAIFYAAILLGAGAGGWATIRLSTDAPLSYAAAAPTIAYAVVQGFGVIRRLFASEPLRWSAYLFLALLVATCGMLGGMFARRMVRSDPSTSTTSGGDGHRRTQGEP